MKHAAFAITCALALAVTACSPKQGQNTYKEGEIGISRAVEYGTVRSLREVNIEGKNSGAGTLLGAGIGAGGGSYVGGGSGNAWATAGAAVVGAVVGTMAEKAMNDRKGIEYTVTMQTGETKTIVQEMGEGEVVFKAGQHVMLQYCDRGENLYVDKCKAGSQYQRLLPVDKMPAFEKKRRKIVKG